MSSALSELGWGASLLISIADCDGSEADIGFLRRLIDTFLRQGLPALEQVLGRPAGSALEVEYPTSSLYQFEAAIAAAQRLAELEVTDSVFDGEVEKYVLDLSLGDLSERPSCAFVITSRGRKGAACGLAAAHFDGRSGGWRCKAHGSTPKLAQ